MLVKSENRLILGIGVLGVTSSSFIFLAADKAPYSLAFVRVLLTGVISYGLILNLINRSSKTQVALTKSDYTKILIAGFSLATHFGWWFASLNYLPVGISLALTNTAPIWLAILLIFIYSIRPKLNQLISMLFVLLASVIFFQDNSGMGREGLQGFALALGSAFGLAIYLVMARSMVPRLGLWNYFGLVNISASGVILLWLVLTRQFQTLLDPTLWFWGLLLAIFPGIMGHAIYNYSMSKLDPIDVSVATLGEPVLGSLIAYLLLDQILSRSQILAVLSLIIAIGFTIQNSYDEL